MENNGVRKIVFAGVVGALYAALTMTLGPISYGPVQFRVAEALCALPFFAPFTVWGLFIGCIAANLLSPYPLDIIVGSIATLLAAVCTMQIGRSWRTNASKRANAPRHENARQDGKTAKRGEISTHAEMPKCEDTPKRGKKPMHGDATTRTSLIVKAFACLPPVVFNAVIIGALLAYYMAGTENAKTFFYAFLINGLQVGAGEAIVMYALGLPLLVYLPQLRVLKNSEVFEAM